MAIALAAPLATMASAQSPSPYTGSDSLVSFYRFGTKWAPSTVLAPLRVKGVASDAFSLGRDSLGVVLGGIATFYTEEEGALKPGKIPSLSLPEGFTAVFGYGDSQAMVAAVADGKALFYARKSGDWARREDMDFSLPAGARGVWCFSLTQLAVPVEDRLRIYERDGSKWVVRTEIEVQIGEAASSLIGGIDAIGVVGPERVVFLSREYGWKPNRDLDFALPPNCRKAFLYGLNKIACLGPA